MILKGIIHFNRLLNMDKAEIKCRFRRSVESYEENAAVQKRIAGRLFQLVEKYAENTLFRMLEVGCGTGLLTRKLKERQGNHVLIINDLVEEMCRKTSAACGIEHNSCLVGDIESVALPGTFNAIVSSSTFQWLNSPEIVFKKFARHLAKEGILAFSTFGKDNLYELKTITHQGLVYPDRFELSAFLAKDFEILYTEETKHTLYFSDPLEIIRHMKRTGVNAVGRADTWTKGRLERFCAEYRLLFSTPRGYPLTYHPLYFVCRKKKDVQDGMNAVPVYSLSNAKTDCITLNSGAN